MQNLWGVDHPATRSMSRWFIEASSGRRPDLRAPPAASEIQRSGAVSAKVGHSLMRVRKSPRLLSPDRSIVSQ